MANQRRVTTTYDSGYNSTAKSEGYPATQGDWGNQAPVDNQDDSSNTLEEVMADFKAARDYVKDNYQSDWEDYWKCYNLIRTRRGYDGISDVFVPESFTIIESVMANIAGGKPKFTFVAMEEEQTQDTKLINALIDFYWEQNRMTQKAQSWVKDMLMYGNGVIMVSWEGDMPRMQNIPLADFFVDPTATHMNNPEEAGYPKYAGYRYLTDRDSLRDRKLVNPDTGELDGYYKNLDEIEDYKEDWDKLDKEVKDGFMGSTLGKDAARKQVECIVYYTKEKKIVIANRKTVIYEGDNPYQRKEKTVNSTIPDPKTGKPTTTKVKLPEIKPFLPFAVLRNYVDPSLFYAKGDLSVIIDQQEQLNDLSNQKMDNITYVLNNMWQIDPQFNHLADQIESVPGAVYPIPAGALQPIEKQVVTGEADAQIAAIKDEMRRATAADEVIQGVTQDKGRITATEVNATLNQASQRFTTKLNTLENEGYAQLGRIMFKMIQIFVTQEMAVRQVGPEGTQWADFNPNDYSGEYEPRVSLESNQKTAKAEEGQKYLQIHQMFANSPLVNQKEFARVYLEKVLDLSEERIKTLLDVPPPPAEPPMPQPTISVSLRADLQPDQEARLLDKLGIQSSPEDLVLAAGATPHNLVGSAGTADAPGKPVGTPLQLPGEMPPGMPQGGPPPGAIPAGMTNGG